MYTWGVGCGMWEFVFVGIRKERSKCTCPWIDLICLGWQSGRRPPLGVPLVCRPAPSERHKASNQNKRPIN